MNIIENDFNWNGALSSRSSTKYIVLHHRAGTGDTASIHAQHLKNGWTGIGYHFYVRHDGGIHRGRPIDAVGAHAVGYNNMSVSVCFEGNFEKDKEMPVDQIKGGQEIVAYLKSLYPDATVLEHKDLGKTACPGKYFPFEKLVTDSAPLLKNADEITWELNHKYFNIEDYEGFIKALDKAKKENSSLYWGYYKLVNK